MKLSIRNYAAFAFVVSIAIVITALALAARSDDAGNRATLAWMAPAVDLLAVIGAPLISHVRTAIVAASSSIVLIAVAALLIRRRSMISDSGRAVLLTVAFAVVAEAAFLWASITLGFVFIASAFLCGFAGRGEHANPPDRFEWRDCAILALLSVCAAIIRFYALNRLPDVFEGELAPYYLAATNLSSIWPANAGVAGPWAPLGFLFYIPVFFSTKFFGTTILAIRFSTAVISIITVALLYSFTLVGFGRTAAVFAAIFFILDPLQIGWGRTDVHPHGVTTWPTILISLTTLTAFRDGQVRWFVLLALLMAISWHQYPSGQTAMLIPIIALGITLVRGQSITRVRTKIALLLTGAAAWGVGSLLVFLPVGPVAGLRHYFDLLGPRVAWNGGEATAPSAGRIAAAFWQAIVFAGDLLAGLFVQLRYTFHQDIFIPVHDLPSRSVSWIVAALTIAGVCLFVNRRGRTTADWVVVAWIIAAILPAVVSDRAYPKRAATLFPALFVLAGVALSEFIAAAGARNRYLRRAAIGLASVGTAAWTCATIYLWFSGTAMAYGKPNETAVAELVAPALQPGTIIVADLWHGYGRGKLAYVLKDALHERSAQPLFWYVVDPDRDLRTLMERPERSIEYARGDTFDYRWGDLSFVSDQARQSTHWKQVIFILQLGLDSQDQLRLARTTTPLQLDDAERIALLHELYPACGVRMLAPRTRCNDCGFLIAACPLPGR